MSQGLNEAPVTDTAVAARDATEASLKAAMEAPPPAERRPHIQPPPAPTTITSPGRRGAGRGGGVAEGRHGGAAPGGAQPAYRAPRRPDHHNGPGQRAPLRR